MQGQFIGGILLGILAALLINVGKAVQKQNVHVFLQGKRAFKRPHRRNLYGWLLGLLMTFSAMVPFSLALMLTESPSIVSSMTGVGLIGLALYAVLVIGERFARLDAIGVALVVVGTSVLSYVSADSEIAGREVLGWAMVRSFGPIIFICSMGCILSFRVRSIWGVSWGITSGTCLGIALVLGDVALMEAEGSFVGQLGNPYPYIAILVSIPALVATQIGFLRARALEVVPAVNSSVIIAPLLLELIMYGAEPDILRVAMIAIIVLGVVMLSMSTGAKASEAPRVSAEQGEDPPVEEVASSATEPIASARGSSGR